MIETRIKLESKIFTELRRALSPVPNRMAREFKESTKQKMLKQTPTGKTYEKGGGRGFKRFHKASSRGQRPQPETLTLVNAVDSRRTGEFSAVADIKDKINPENKANAKEYAEILVEKMGREIFTKEDLKEAQAKQDSLVEKVIRELI